MTKEYSSAQGLAYNNQKAKPRSNAVITTANHNAGKKSRKTKGNKSTAPYAYADYATAFEGEQARVRKRRKRLIHLSVMTIIICMTVGGFEPLYTQVTGNIPHDDGIAMLIEIKDALIPAAPAPEDPMDIVVERIKTQAAVNPYIHQGERNPLFDINTLQSSAAVLANLDSGDVIIQKNQKLRVYPASLTKIMTVLLAIEHRDSLPDTLVMDMGIYPRLYSSSATLAGFLPGEEVTFDDLIYGALLPSGGECCVALAVAIAGTEEQFADLMNQRAKELGMYDTHFTNSTGLHDDEHFTTARDLCILLQFALNNTEFQEAFKSKEYLIPPTNLRKESRLLESGFFERAERVNFEGGEILGGKTGYTPEAGQCLASLAVKNDELYIFISTGNNVKNTGDFYSISDALNVYENGLS